jgi:hypothetical protein
MWWIKCSGAIMSNIKLSPKAKYRAVYCQHGNEGRKSQGHDVRMDMAKLELGGGCDLWIIGIRYGKRVGGLVAGRRVW